MSVKLYNRIASLLVAIENCRKSNNEEWRCKHEAQIKSWVRDLMPSGSGVDNGTKLDFDRSSPDRLVFTFGYHHMNDGGYYDGWSEHTAIVTASLSSGFDLRITGRDRRGIKEYLQDLYSGALDQVIGGEK